MEDNPAYIEEILGSEGDHSLYQWEEVDMEWQGCLMVEVGVIWNGVIELLILPYSLPCMEKIKGD